MGSRVGVTKIAARRTGLSVDRYRDHIAAGLRYCWGCELWHPKGSFGKDVHRAEGRNAICRDKKNELARNKWKTQK